MVPVLPYDSLESFTLIWNLERVKQEHYAKKYLDQEKKGPNADKEIGTLKRGRPLMLETVDEKVCSFLQIIRRKGGVVNSIVAIAIAKALIAKSDLEHQKALDLENSSWTKSLFWRMDFVRRAKITSKPEIRERGKKEVTQLFRTIKLSILSWSHQCRLILIKHP